tara:strand:+ start:2239 stop:3087 length:849 start_codon:yes stop_codon:yes gene_type:complete
MSHKKIFGAIRSEQNQFISLQEDNKLNNGSPEERELRTKYPFANVFLEFPTTGESAVFPAYMKAFQDTFSPTFSPISVFGRQDDIPVYQSTKRSISFSLVMPAYNELHAVDILRDINTIIKNLYPSYVKTETNKTRIINSPPLIRVKFANLICDYTNPTRGLLGYVNGSVNVSHGIDTNGLFIIEDEFGGSVYVKTYELSFNMSILHEETPGFDPENGGFIESQQFPYTLQGDAIPFTAEQSEGLFNPAEQAVELTTISLSNGNAIGSLAKKIGKLITESGT